MIKIPALAALAAMERARRAYHIHNSATFGELRDRLRSAGIFSIKRSRTGGRGHRPPARHRPGEG